ncbi:MAG: hypothetical protein IJ604_09280 [Prevotella sp.]|nr:hypothetical protein [Prevotella sp.]
MKNIYVKPVTEVFVLKIEKHFCASYKLNRYSRFGNPHWDDYGNESWVNEGWEGRRFTDYPFDSVPIDDDYGNLDSRGKGSLWDDDDM